MVHRILMGALVIVVLVSGYYMYTLLGKIFAVIAEALSI